MTLENAALPNVGRIVELLTRLWFTYSTPYRR